MKSVTLRIEKKQVYNEVAQTTSYTGAKMEDEHAYDRIFTTDEDESMLERFWSESKNAICNSLKKMLVSENETDGIYVLQLDVSNSYDEALTESMQRSLFSYFVMNITSKWYTFSNKGEAGEYALQAATYVEDILRKVFYKKKPIRPTYN